MATHFYLMEAIIYHRVDWDGYTAAAVALRAFPDAELIGWNYKDPFPVVDSYDRVVLVDLTIYSQRPDGSQDFSWMINNQDRLIWFDHHPIIKNVPGEYCGVRKEGLGACWLVWEYFHKTRGITFSNVEHIKLCATFDAFEKTGKLCSWEDAWAYQLYLNRLSSCWTPKEDDFCRKQVKHAEALLEEYDAEREMHLRDGRMFEYERSLREKAVFDKYAKHITVDGHAGWLVETMEQPSVIIKDHSDSNDGEVFILWHPDKKNKDGNYVLSIRRSKDSDFDCRAFAKKHDGDGHVPAAGCAMSEEELQSLL